jgi:predicted dehydrogenase
LRDFRRALDDPAVDGVLIATPNHWHAPATLMALAAGKHVYVEKPCSHNPDEGERMIAAARSASRVVQVGTQRRSSPLYKQVVEKVRAGEIGEVLYSKSWYNSARPSIGFGKPIAPPDWLDYDLWQGPVETRPYQDNLIHYNWHFFWHWGNGELGNNGIHTIDITRWAMDVDYPSRVTVAGRKLRYNDDQQTPDTMTVSYDFGDRMMVWEGIAWSGPYQTKSTIGIELRGQAGTLFVDDSGYKHFDSAGKLIEEGTGGRGDSEHFSGFVSSIRTGAPLAANITEAHKSTMYCHLGNIAYRTGGSLDVDATNGHVVGNAEASKLWSREYREGWLPA